MPRFYSPVTILVPPASDLDAVRRGDLIAAVESKFKLPVRAATTAALAATYLSKVLTASADGALVLDGVTMAVGQRVLVKDQTDAEYNGLYVVTAAGAANAPFALTRSVDFDESAKIYAGVKIHVTEGATYKEANFVLATDDPIDLDTTGLSFVPDTGLFAGIRQYVGTIASGVTGPATVTHNLNTTNVTVEVFSVADGQTVFPTVTRDSADTVVLGFVGTLTEAFTVIVRAA
jgi:hypothetical protein